MLYVRSAMLLYETRPFVSVTIAGVLSKRITEYYITIVDDAIMRHVSVLEYSVRSATQQA